MTDSKSDILDRLQGICGEDFHPILKIADNCDFLQGVVDEIKIPLRHTHEDGEAVVQARKAKAAAIQIANAEWARLAEYTIPKTIDVNLAVEITEVPL